MNIWHDPGAASPMAHPSLPRGRHDGVWSFFTRFEVALLYHALRAAGQACDDFREV